MVLVFGAVNIDLVSRVERFPTPGETIAGASFATYPGGKGANQALASARAGAKTYLAGAVGRDAFALAALALVDSAGVDLTHVARVEQRTGCATILVSDYGENMIVSVPGANAAADAAAIPDALLGRATVLSLQHELPARANDAMIERARRNGARIVLNASPWRAQSRDMLNSIDYLVVNEHEATALAAAFGWPALPEQLAQAATAAVPGLTVIVTLGEQGAIAARGETLHRVEAPAVRVIDSTGAGDAFTGTFAAALDRGNALDQALRCAAVAGSLACTVAGAQPSFPERAAVDAVLERDGPAAA